MQSSRNLLLAGCVLLLSACAGTNVDPNDPGVQGNYFGAAMGDGFREMAANQSVDQGPLGAKPTGYSTTVCPGTTIQRGLDVSYYQGTINWSSVKSAGKQFVFIRVSDGTGFVDPNFGTYWAGAKAVGLTVGAYQYFRPSGDPIAQADLMVNKIQAAGYASTDIPPVIDVETTEGLSASTVLSRVNSWLSRVQSRTGRQPVLYTSPGFWNSIGAPQPTPLPYLWVANWGVSCPTLPAPWGRLRFWQYTDTGTVSGVSGSVDLDEYNGSLTEMRSL